MCACVCVHTCARAKLAGLFRDTDAGLGPPNISTVPLLPSLQVEKGALLPLPVSECQCPKVSSPIVPKAGHGRLSLPLAHLPQVGREAANEASALGKSDMATTNGSPEDS